MFEEFLNNKDSWLSGKGPHSEIVFSSRVRLARNLGDYPFPSRMNASQKNSLLSKIKDVVLKSKHLRGNIFVKMLELSELDKRFLLERHLVSQEHVLSAQGKGLTVFHNEKVSIMINEEDHLRIQVIASGFNLKQCWNIASDIDTELNRNVSFSFMPDLGYLTACPTNVGTGLRASCMLHLPALVLTKRINKILELLAKISFTTRGLFGEGTQALGNFFQISNQVSLGLSEQELIGNLSGVVNQVRSQEIDARDILLRKYKHNIEDNVWRALGSLRYSRLISTKEALSHLSMLSLGLDLGIIKDKSFPKGGPPKELINNLFIIIQPAHLQKIEGKTLKEQDRDYIRAAILRDRLTA